MTKKHMANKVFAELKAELPKEYQHRVAEFCEKHGLDPTVMTKKDIVLKIIDLALSNDGFETSDSNLANDGFEISDEHSFECNKLCKKFRQCTSPAMFELQEIIAQNCYVSKYPYEWTTPDGRDVRVCKYMVFPNGFPHDPKNPYPQCIHSKPLVHLPKDRIVRDPQICWTCYMAQKKAREEKILKKVMRDEYAGQPRVNWYAHQ